MDTVGMCVYIAALYIIAICTYVYTRGYSISSDKVCTAIASL